MLGEGIITREMPSLAEPIGPTRAESARGHVLAWVRGDYIYTHELLMRTLRLAPQFISLRGQYRLDALSTCLVSFLSHKYNTAIITPPTTAPSIVALNSTREA